MPKAEIFSSLFDEPSTAAGESLLKAFGPLVLSSGDAKRFKLQFTLHPAEIALLSYLRKLKTRAPVPQNAAFEFLHHMGYLHVEVQQTIELLAAREHLRIDERGDLHLFNSEFATHKMLTEKLSALQSNVRLLQIKPAEVETRTNFREMQAVITRIQESLDQRVSEIEQEIAASIDSHRALVGSVMAASVPTSWPQSELSTHLEGVSSVLRKSREDLLRGLQSDLETAAKLKESFDGVASAARWLNVRSRLGNKYQKLNGRVMQFIERVTALSAWEPLAHELQSTRLLCDRVIDTDVGQSVALDKVTEKYRERFATDPWEPLFEASSFARELVSVQAGVQSLLFRYLENYLSQQRTLVSRYGDLLGHSPPDFSLAERKNTSVRAIEAAYQRLYQWALKGLQTVVSECRKRKDSGAEWRDSQKRVTWKEASAKVDQAMKRATSGGAAFDRILDLGAKVERMASGFPAVNAKDTLRWVRRFDDPDACPDFDELQKLFAEGKITIHVERRAPRV